MSFISILPKPKSRRKNFTISRRRKSQLVFSRQVVTNQCCGLAVIFCGFISHLIGHETINIPGIFSGVHGFTGKTVNPSPCFWMNVFVYGGPEFNSPTVCTCSVQLGFEQVSFQFYLTIFVSLFIVSSPVNIAVLNALTF